MACDLTPGSDVILEGQFPSSSFFDLHDFQSKPCDCELCTPSYAQQSSTLGFLSSSESVFQPHQLKQVLQRTIPEKIAFFNKEKLDMTLIISRLLRHLEYHPLAQQIAQKNAFFVVDLGVLVRKLEEFVSALPMVKPHFAVKCNPNPVIVKLLAKLGVNFDCASSFEIDLVSNILASEPLMEGKTEEEIADRIIFANPCKPVAHLRHARHANVKRMTFDAEEELYKIAKEYPDAHLLLRIATNDAHSLVPLSSKFGAQEKNIPRLLQVAQSLNLKVIGVAFHVGSGCSSAHSYIDALEISKRVFRHARDQGLPEMTVLDIGGGFPGFENEAKVTFAEIAAVIAPVLERDFAEYEIIAEPGRFFVGQCHTMVNQITSKKLFRDENDIAQIAHYFMGDGVYNSFKNRVLYDVDFDDRLCTDLVGTLDPTSESDTNDENENAAINIIKEDALIPSTLWGPTCDSLDKITKNILLPECQVGDWLYWINMGAYTTSLAGDFNGFGRSPVLYIATI